jgi:type I restriction enzyme S subunit
MVRASISEVKTSMIDDIKPYPGYKDSGIPWVARVPHGWRIEPGFAAFREKQERNIGLVEKRVLSLSYGRIVIKPEDKLHGLVPESFETYQVVNPGDIIIRSTDLQNDWNSLRVGLVRDRGIITSAYLCLKMLGPLSFEYGYLQLHALDLMKVFYGMGSGLRQNLAFSDFKRMPILIPPSEEQNAIVSFLNHANRRIELCIRAKKKLITLLSEQKQSIIHHAVTRGFNSSVSLKPSGIAWLGDIPEHWEVWRISRFARVGNGSTPSRGNAEYWIKGTYPWLNSSNVNRGFIDNANQFVTKTALDECHLPRVPPGSVLVAITGQGKTRGTAAVLGIEATINQHIAFITPRSAIIIPEFLQLALTGAYKTLRALSDDSGSTKGALTCEDLKKFKLAVPPEYEQMDLVTQIKAATNDIDVVINRTQREIDLIREYRTRLIADVVTGKLDVRKVAAKLPEEANDVQELSHNIGDAEIEEIEAADDLSGERDE